MRLYKERKVLMEQKELAAVSADGNVRQRIILSEGDVREPAWSPVIR